MFLYLVQGVALGFAAAVQPGPFQTYLISQTARNGWRRTLPVVLAPLLSDGPIIGLALLVLSNIPIWWIQALRLAGGVNILYLAVGALRSWRAFDTQAPAVQPGPQSVLQATLVNLLNPAPYIYWSVIAGPLLLTGWHAAPLNGIGFLAGFYATLVASLVGIILLCAGAGRLGPRLNRGLLGLSGITLVGLGLYQIWLGVVVVWAGG